MNDLEQLIRSIYTLLGHEGAKRLWTALDEGRESEVIVLLGDRIEANEPGFFSPPTTKK